MQAVTTTDRTYKAKVKKRKSDATDILKCSIDSPNEHYYRRLKKFTNSTCEKLFEKICIIMETLFEEECNIRKYANEKSPSPFKNITNPVNTSTCLKKAQILLTLCYSQKMKLLEQKRQFHTDMQEFCEKFDVVVRSKHDISEVRLAFVALPLTKKKLDENQQSYDRICEDAKQRGLEVVLSNCHVDEIDIPKNIQDSEDLLSIKYKEEYGDLLSIYSLENLNSSSKRKRVDTDFTKDELKILNDDKFSLLIEVFYSCFDCWSQNQRKSIAISLAKIRMFCTVCKVLLNIDK